MGGHSAFIFIQRGRNSTAVFHALKPLSRSSTFLGPLILFCLLVEIKLFGLRVIAFPAMRVYQFPVFVVVEPEKSLCRVRGDSEGRLEQNARLSWDGTPLELSRNRVRP